MTAAPTTGSASPQPESPSGATAGSAGDDIDAFLPKPGEKVADPVHFVDAVAVSTSHLRTYQVMVMPPTGESKVVFGAVDRTDPASPKVSYDWSDSKDPKGGYKAVLIRDIVYTQFRADRDTVWRTPLKDVPAGVREGLRLLLEPMDTFRTELQGLPLTFESSYATGGGTRYSFIGAPGTGRPDYRGTYEDITVDEHLHLLRSATMSASRSAGSFNLSALDEKQYIEIPYGPVKDLPGSGWKKSGTR